MQWLLQAPVIGYLLRLSRAVIRGQMRGCDVCGRFTQCLPFSENMSSHWDAIEEINDKHGVIGGTAADPNAWRQPIPEPFLNYRVCEQCNSDLGFRLGLHDLCCNAIAGLHRFRPVPHR